VVAVRSESLPPQLFGKLLAVFFAAKISYTGSLIEHVSLLTHKWNLHLIVLIKVFFVVLNEKFANFSQLALSLRDAI
jgi:hypothetical protein